MQGVQLFINISDDDSDHVRNPNQDDLVDTLLIDHNLPIGESTRQTYTGVYNFITVDLTVRAVCAEYFTGENCTQCVPGNTGELCNTKVEDLDSSESVNQMYTSSNPPDQQLQTEFTSDRDVNISNVAG